MAEKEERRIEQIPEKVEQFEKRERSDDSGSYERTPILEDTRDTLPPPPEPSSPKPEDKGD